ncbi:MAG: hypothetical protein KME65_13445 [Candidatus Thiodiazotropha sp. (ex Ctena orbiculata)]|uniref:Uncharacterized protein n=1 Tax=Candidatus Thiodiazotropha taylori TaxID=2792791 RepID=A0A944M9X3_9GAMM|nr:hypothetical protein [Candidatus Thiodiazotropha taylori]
MKFKRIVMRGWKGRYARIPGDASVLHLKWVDGRYRTSIYWSRDDEIATCVATDSAEEMALAEAVSEAKRTMGGNGGGSFQINEFRQVIVPSSQGGMKRLLVGEISGEMGFDYPWEEGYMFDLSDVDGYDSGDIWERPYIGMRFNLSKGSKIYFWQEGREGGQSLYPERQDEELIRKLRAIRSWGAMRFIVNPWGIVLTKRPQQDAWKGDDSAWVPVYVGRINPGNWFKKEE